MLGSFIQAFIICKNVRKVIKTDSHWSYIGLANKCGNNMYTDETLVLAYTRAASAWQPHR